MEVEEFAKKYKIPIFRASSRFPQYYASHAINTLDVLDQKYLYSAKKLDTINYSTKIDEYLGATDFIFFGLGKGYLSKNKPSVGLIYEPFELIKVSGVNLVENDLLYVLEEKKLLNDFLLKNWPEIQKILRNNLPDNKISEFKRYLVNA